MRDFAFMARYGYQQLHGLLGRAPDELETRLFLHALDELIETEVNAKS